MQQYTIHSFTVIKHFKVEINFKIISFYLLHLFLFLSTIFSNKMEYSVENPSMHNEKLQSQLSSWQNKNTVKFKSLNQLTSLE